MSKKTRDLLIFFLATFALTWACYVTIIFLGLNPYQMPGMILLITGGMSPSLVGILMVLFTYDRDRRRDFWKRCFSFKQIKMVWWVVIFLLFPLISAVSIALDLSLGGSLPGMAQLKSLIAQPLMWPLAVFISFMSGPWSEEFGWRGVALDPLMERLGRLPAGLLMGLIWGVWHLPLFFMPETGHGKLGFGVAGFPMFMLYNFGLSLLMMWVFVYTDRSILSAMLMHFTSNFSGQLLDPLSDRVHIIQPILFLIIGLTVCILMERRAHRQEPRAVAAVEFR